MSAPLTFQDRFLAVVIPTKQQAITSFIAAFAIVCLGQAQFILSKLGVGERDLQSISEQFTARFGAVLKSDIAGQLVVVTFWASVGLVAYLICWGAYNVLIEARNEVTLNTVYTNRGHWRGPFQTLGLKAAAAIGLVAALATLWPGVSYWISAVGQFIAGPNPVSGLLAVLALAACAVQLYVLFALIQLTFMPWYRAEAFTEE